MTMAVRIRRSVLDAAFAMTLFGVTTQVSAQERCSAATLRGNYGFRVEGTAFASPFAAVGRNNYNGRGAMRGVIVVTVGNQPTFGPFAFGEDSVAPYTVNADCTGTKSVTLPVFGTITFWFVIDDDAREVRMIVVGDPNVTVSGTARKLTSDGHRQ
jgi:hypothetical protein